ncbi:PadR family transcriptional regulator [Streptomyces sp. SID10815]|uniref:PadR family transcriptional regulator n=1 Tax=Streptomyces sp. SID10815 TaxID=2706027 RepID=UPI0013C5B162|nr:PadR family transcriptional regulator [Streptomyces sp. SID10815]NEA51104.1 PadR family transcriptional regulator [Streptomyces sp. SID10815]
MSTRHGLLALLEDGPRHGSRLRAEFAVRTGAARPPDPGRVCAALGALERDGLVAREGVDAAGRVIYALTGAGRAELRDWYTRPVRHTGPSCEERAVRLALAVAAPGVDVREVVEEQRRQVSEELQDYVRQRAEVLARGPERPEEVARLLVLEQRICHAEGESRWLDHCAARLLRLHLADGADGTDGADRIDDADRTDGRGGTDGADDTDGTEGTDGAGTADAAE